MKFLHLADLHLGKRVNGFSMLEDQAHILRQILAILDDEQPDGVLIAEHGILFRSGRRLPDSAGEWVEAGRLFSLEPASEKKQGFDRNAYELLIQRALEQLTAAKSLHDELEGYYVGRMDFQKWQGVLDEILRQQE